MAKKAAEKEKKAEAPAKPEYGVPELAEFMGLEPTSVRVKLRNAGIEKSGRSYGWKTKKDMEACAKQLKSAEKDAADDGDKPSKKKRGGKKAD